MRLLPFLALACLWAGAAHGASALRWDRKTVETETGSAEKTARAEFVFTNVSKQPVVIDSVKPGCGCTTAALDKKTYEPGEKGHITAVFTPGSRQGVQVKAIKVTVKGEPDPAVLTMVTRVGDTVQIDPPLVLWRLGEPFEPKTIQVKVPSSSGLRLTRVQSGNPQIAAKLSTLKEGSEYQITVTPGDIRERAVVVLKIQGLTRSNEPKEFQAYAQVK